MSLLIDWTHDNSHDEGQDVVMHEPESSWNPRSAVFRAGRELSDWFFGRSPPVSPSFVLPREYSATPSHATADKSMHHIEQPSTRSTYHSATVHSLPTELLQEIFEQYLFGPRSRNLGPRPLRGSYERVLTHTKAQTTPIHLAHICSSWRTLVMASPSLWSKLCAWCPVADDLPLFEFWLARSLGCALDVHIIASDSAETPSATSTTLRLLTSLMQVSARWRRLSLHLGSDVETFFKLVPQHALLELIALDLSLLDWSADGTRSIARYLTSSPHLRDIGWGEMCLVPSLLAQTPWATLTSFRIGRISLEDLHCALPQMTTIQTLDLQAVEVPKEGGSTGSSQTNVVPIVLPHLSHLSLGCYGDIGVIVDCLTLPSLSELVLESGVGFHWPRVGSGPEGLFRLVHRSACRVASLQWSHSSLPQENLLQFMERASTTIMPDLRHLKIVTRVESPIVEFLALKDDGPFPCLESLEFQTCKATQDSIVALKASRPTLSTFNFWSHSQHFHLW